MNGRAEIYGQTQTFNYTGSSQFFTVPPGVTNVTVEVWGGGGAGGGVDATPLVTGGGGGGGTYTKVTGVAVTPNGTVAVTVGAGGVAASAANGGAGGISTFGSAIPVSAVGGNGGFKNIGTAHGLGATAATGITFSGGAGGVGYTNGNTNLSPIGGGGGGGSAGSLGSGYAPELGIDGGRGGLGTTSNNTGGTGAYKIDFLGAMGGDGVNAFGLAAGGSGARNDASGGTKLGGNGGNGRIIVSYGPVLNVNVLNPTPTDHGSSCVGTAASSKTYTIENLSANAATGILVTSSDPQFVVSALSSTSIPAAGGSPGSNTATFTVTFTPTSGGTQNSNITVSGTPALGNTPVLGVTGIGVVPPTAPFAGTPTNPTCSVLTGSVLLSGLPAAGGTVTATSSDGLSIIIKPAPGATFTFTGLVAGKTYRFTVASTGPPSCTSPASNSVMIGAAVANTGTLTSNAASATQTVCVNTGIANIRYTTLNATGAIFADLPSGVTGTFTAGVGAAGSILISGTPTVSGTFAPVVTLTGGCGSVDLPVLSLTVNAANTITLSSVSGTDGQTVCANTPITDIKYATTGVTGPVSPTSVIVTGLPAGVTGTWTAGVGTAGTVTISGTPTASGTFNYTVTELTGGCGTVTATGTITVGTATSISYAGPYCKVGTANVTLVGTTGGTYTISPSVPVSSVGASFATTGAIDLATIPAGNYIVRYTYTTPGCSFDIASTNVVINAVPAMPTLSESPLVACVGTGVSIRGSISPTTPTGAFPTPTYNHVWTLTGTATQNSGGGISTLNSSTAMFTPTAAGQFTVYYNVTDVYGCVSATKNVIVDAYAPPVATSAGPDKTQCENPDFMLAAQALSDQPANTKGLWTVVSGGDVSMTITEPKSPTTTVTGVPNGVTVLKWTVTNGSCTPQSATVTLTNQIVRLSNPLSTPFTTTVCSGEALDFTAKSTSSSPSFSWTRTAVLGGGITPATGAGSGAINTEVLTNTTSHAIDVTYLYTTSSGGCSNPIAEPVIVRVNPKPNITTRFTRSVCSGAGFTPVIPQDGTDGIVPSVTTYKWLAPTVTGGMTGGAAGLAASNLTKIDGVLTNPTNLVQTATYEVTPIYGTCTGDKFTVVVTVNPTPSVASYTAPTQCSGLFASTPVVNGINGPLTYSWTVAPGAVTGASAGSGTVIGTDVVGLVSTPTTLVNGTPADVDVVYTVTPSAGGCTGTPFTVTVKVKPSPTMNSANSIAPICNNTDASYRPTSGTFGATFEWTRDATAFQPSASGTAAAGGTVSEKLLNPSNAQITVTYHYKAVSPDGCKGVLDHVVTVAVNPTPALVTPAITVCSPAPGFTHTATSTAGSGTFSWTRAAVPNLTPALPEVTSLAPVNSATITEGLTNTTTEPINVSYVFSMTSAAGCSNTSTQTLVVTVNPKPKLSNSTLVAPAICSGGTVSYTAKSATTGATITWVRRDNFGNITPSPAAAIITPPTPAVGSGSGPSTGTLIGEPLTNTTVNPITVIYDVTTSTAITNGVTCSTREQVTVVVNPTPKMSGTFPMALTAICSGTVPAFTPTSATTLPAAPTYSWVRTDPSGMNAPLSGTGPITGALVNTGTTPITVTYVYTTTVNGSTCSGAPQTVTVVVNPVVTLTPPYTASAICSGAAMDYTATSPIAGTTFKWTRAAVSGISNAAVTTLISGSTPGSTLGEILVANGPNNAPVTVTYNFIATANGCSNSQDVTVDVKPKAVVNNLAAAICSEGTFAFLPQNSTDGVVPANTTYTWSAPTFLIGSTGDIIGGVGGSAASIISGTLTNKTNILGKVRYMVTASSGGCVGNTFPVDVTVNPKATITDMTVTAACNGSFSVTPQNGVAPANGVVPALTTYKWEVPSVPNGLTGGAAGPETSNLGSIGGTLINSTATAQTAIYTVTPITGSCTGTPFKVTVTVNPVPVVQGTTAIRCHGGSFDFTPTATTIPANTTYTWPGGSGDFFSSGTLSNLTGAPVLVRYAVTPTSGTCQGAPFNIDITINPTPTMPLIPLSVCEGATATLSGSPAGGTWTSATPTVAKISSGGLVTGVSDGQSIMTYTSGGCTNTTTVTVNAKPVATLVAPTSINQGCSGVPISVTMTPASGTYTPNIWSVDNSGLLAVVGSGLATTLTAPTTFPPVSDATLVTVSFKTTDAHGCVSDVIKKKLTVYPELVVNLGSGTAPLCMGTTITLPITGITGGNPTSRTIVYSSSNPAVATVDATSGLITAVASSPTPITISAVVTDASGCSVTGTRSVKVNPALAVTATATPAACFGASSGVICLSPLAGTETLKWSPNNTTSAPCYAGIPAGNYSVVISDATTGCTQTISNITVGQPTSAVTASISGNAGSCEGGTAAKVTFTAGGGTAPYSFTYAINGVIQSPISAGVGVGATPLTAAVQQSTVSPGKFTYTLISVSDASCTQSQTGTADITVGASITKPNAGLPATIVDGTYILLGSAVPVTIPATTGKWTVVSPVPNIVKIVNDASPTTAVSDIVGATTFRWTLSNTGGCSISDDVVITRTPIKVAIIAALEGPLNNVTGRMYTNIVTIIPDDGSVNHYPDANVRAQTGRSAIVDWVTIELRTTATTPTTGNYVRRGLIRADGQIVEASDGVSPLKFDVPEGKYFISIKHRNHLGFRSSVAVNLTVASSPSNFSNQNLIFNFATGQTSAFGTNSLKFINGVYCAFAGDGILDIFAEVSSVDYNEWKQKRFVDGYEPADFNLDGTVDSGDYILWKLNNQKFEQY